MHFPNLSLVIAHMNVSKMYIKQHDKQITREILAYTCNDNTSSFTDLLEIDNSVSVHHRNIQVLVTELFKFVNILSLKLVSDCFKPIDMTVYNSRNRSTLYSRTIRIVLYGTESFSHLEPKI